jgi:predicted nucleotidyltransferase component of viral defense system
MAHSIYIDSLMSESLLSCEQIAFHGGTSLHLSWRSPRYSEDLDFLLSREVSNLDEISDRILASIRESFIAIDPMITVEMKNKSKSPDRMFVFSILVSHPGFIGNAMVKAEFWRVDPIYLKKYPTEFRTPASLGDVISRLSSPVPAAKLETAYCDKLTAFATRPYLKWRDIYDLWWIGTQTGAELDIPDVIEQFKHNVSAYQTLQGLSPSDALKLFLNNDRAKILKSADPDLKKWLPKKLWERLNPDGVAQMVDYTFYALKTIAEAMDTQSTNGSTHVSLKMLPRR